MLWNRLGCGKITSDSLILVNIGFEVIQKNYSLSHINGAHSKLYILIIIAYHKSTNSFPFSTLVIGTIHSSNSFRCFSQNRGRVKKGNILVTNDLLSTLIIDKGCSIHNITIEYQSMNCWREISRKCYHNRYDTLRKSILNFYE